MNSQKKYWFPARRYGWGWGIPNCWQGWAVFAAYAVLLALAWFWFPPDERVVAFLSGIGLVTAGFIAVLWLKGEPPSWRWG